MALFESTVVLCGGIATILGFLSLLIKPIREKILGMDKFRQGQICILRADLLRTYYANKDNETIREYEKEAFIKEYEAYLSVQGGDSFIEDCYNELRKWDVQR